METSVPSGDLKMNPFCPSHQMPTEFFGTGNARISDINDIVGRAPGLPCAKDNYSTQGGSCIEW